MWVSSTFPFWGSWHNPPKRWIKTSKWRNCFEPPLNSGRFRLVSAQTRPPELTCSLKLNRGLKPSKTRALSTTQSRLMSCGRGHHWLSRNLLPKGMNSRSIAKCRVFLHKGTKSFTRKPRSGVRPTTYRNPDFLIPELNLVPQFGNSGLSRISFLSRRNLMI